ncbi:MAG: ATP-binding cassette domain-containing protein [Bacteroidales bacterium]|nr:ATP-binding cassette domain-containing protein [Bacteroidales bacterium]
MDFNTILRYTFIHSIIYLIHNDQMIHSLEIDSIFLEYGLKKVLQNVYIKSETGKATGLLGRNGAGKSCLLKIVFGELDAGNKSVRIDGKPILHDYRKPDDLRYLPQRRFIPGFLRLNRIFKDFNLDFNDFINEFPDFEKYYKTRIKNLSGGERRIVEIYMILVAKTKFCILDEPFSQIMPLHIEIIKKLILREKQYKGIIITDHLYQDIIDVCNNIYVLKNGKTHIVYSLRDLEILEYINA